MSISITRVEAPGEKWDTERSDGDIVPTLPVVLGRGSLLKCGDKKISRRHAYLDWDDDGVRITSVYQTPVFVVAKGVAKELEEGDSQLLVHGDRFGLLETNFWYRINLPKSLEEEDSAVSPKAGEETEKARLKGKAASSSENDIVENGVELDALNPEGRGETSSSIKEQPKTVDDPCNEVADHNANDINGPSGEEKKNGVAKEKVVSKKEEVITGARLTVSAQEIQNAVSSRTRELPSWMKTVDTSSSVSPQKETQKYHSHGGNHKIQATGTRRKRSQLSKSQVYEESTVTPKVKKSPAKALSHESEEENIEPQNARKAQKKPQVTSPSPRKNATPKKNKGSPLKNKTVGLHAMSDEDSELEAVSEEEGEKQSPKKNLVAKKRNSPAKKQSLARHDMSDEEEADAMDDDVSEDVTGTSSTTAAHTNTASPAHKQKPRPPCRFGANCYRKNPKHHSDFSHDGDSDYHEITSDPEDSDDDRPHCEYGVDCYRKNPQHRKDYQHSRIPQPQRRVKRKARQQKKGNGSDSDDYDYDDPFLDDGSSDDYAPTDSDSDSPMEVDGDNEDDMRRMLKEGKKFVKKR